jgi:hypothetical protein
VRPIVAPEHRPTLGETLAPLPRPARWAVIAVLVLLVIGLVIALTGKATADGKVIVRERPIAFNLRVPTGYTQLTPAAGEWSHLARPGKDSFMVEPLSLPAYRGDVGGVLPIVAARELEALKKRFPALEPVEEGKGRINQAAAYSVVFRASRKPRLYGRVVLLAQPAPGARDGYRIVMLATPTGGADKAADVAARGMLKTPYRTFRFGTEGP